MLVCVCVNEYKIFKRMHRWKQCSRKSDSSSTAVSAGLRLKIHRHSYVCYVMFHEKAASNVSYHIISLDGSTIHTATVANVTVQIQLCVSPSLLFDVKRLY